MEAKRAFLQAAAIGIMGYLVVLFIRATGKRHIAGLVRLLVIALLLSSVVQVVSAVTESVAEFFRPLVRLAEKLTNEEGGWAKFWDFMTRYPKEGK